MNTLTKSFILCATAGALVACDGNDDQTSSANEIQTLSIATTNLEPLGSDYNYEGWLIINGQAISAGIFDIENGAPAPSSFEIAAEDADAATHYVLTIEPAVDDDPNPSSTHIVAGRIVNGIADATTSDAAALGTDFADAQGTYINATPTNGNATPEQGVWFLDPTTSPASASLDLPSLPEGWAYEGWVVIEGAPVSTGYFTDPAMADSDGAGATAGPQAAPNFPGQDFIDPAINISTATVVISVEPMPDNSPAPFSIKPLLSENGMTTLSNIVDTNLPSAVIVIQ